MQRFLDAIGYHSGLDAQETVAIVLAPFLCLAMLVSVGLSMVLR